MDELEPWLITEVQASRARAGEMQQMHELQRKDAEARAARVAEREAAEARERAVTEAAAREKAEIRAAGRFRVLHQDQYNSALAYIKVKDRGEAPWEGAARPRAAMLSTADSVRVSRREPEPEPYA